VLNTARLLLVDDDPGILESAKDILEDAGYLVDVRSTVHSALESLRAQPPAIMLVDFNLPDGNGVDLARAARALLPGLKVILMTGQEKVDVSSAGGAVTISLAKPVAPSDLLAILAQLLKPSL